MNKTFKQYLYEAQMQNWKSLIEGSPELKSALELISIIEDETGKETLLVGGCVRDLMLGQIPHDIDIATAAPLSNIERLFKTHDIGKSKDFGIVVVKHNGFDYEIANFRVDRFSDTADGRRPISVDIAQSFKEDSLRRDFTVNSLGIDRNGEIVDYQGGLDDLNNQIIRAVGTPEKRFIEDALRILRMLRFSIKLGFEIEDETLNAAKGLVHLTDNLSKERIQEELYKVASISGPALAQYIEKMDEIGLLQRVLPEVYAMKGMPHDPKHHPEGGVIEHVISALGYSRSNNPVVNLGILLHDVGKPVSYSPRKEHKGRVRIHIYDGHDVAGSKIIEQIGRRLKLPNSDIKALQFAAYRHMVLHNPERLKASKLAALVNDPNWPILKEVAYCDELARGDLNPNEIAQKFEDIENHVKTNLGSGDELKARLKTLINGSKIIRWIPEINTPENRPKIGQILSSITSYIIDNNMFDITEQEVKQMVQDLWRKYYEK